MTETAMETVTCPTCQRETLIDKDGYLVDHKGQNHKRKCDRSGMHKSLLPNRPPESITRHLRFLGF